MGILLYVGLFIVALAVLLFASDKFIESAEKIGLSFGISPFVIGVTIVAFGTSLPELATSIASVYAGASEIVIGNVVGSNITNILLVLGLAAVFGKGIKLDFDVFRSDMPMLIASCIFLYFIVADKVVSPVECIVLLAALVGFLMSSFSADKTDKADRPSVDWKTYMTLILGGIAVYFGAEYTIISITKISEYFSVPTEVIAVTVVALGTSLPEIAVSLAAVRKGKHAMAVGNVLGSNIFNTYAVIAIPGLLGDLVIPDSIESFSLPYMLAITGLFAICCISRWISRWEGYTLIVAYIYFMYHVSQSAG